MAAADVNQIRRLAQYRPFDRGGLDLRAVLHDLVVAAAALQGGGFPSLLECRKGFKDAWGVTVEVEELAPVVDQLVDGGVAEVEGRGFRLTSATLSRLEAKARESDEVEARAMREWALAVRHVTPTLSDDELDALRQDLRQWLHLVITRHGAEAAMILYPEEERAHRFFDELDTKGFDALPERSAALATVRDEALPLFIRCPTPDQRRFLANLLNTSFYMTVLTIDPVAKKLAEAQLQGHRIYLDTNFLYAVLGAATPMEVYSARRLVELSKALGFELAVTPWTVNELRTSIARSHRQIEGQKDFVRPELAKTMLAAAGDSGFSRLFWTTYRDKRTNPKDFFERLDHFEHELERYGITKVEEGCLRIERQEERVKEYASLLNAERWPYQKDWVVLEHDAKCRLLVERLRGGGHMRFSNARYWFLTHDTKLPRYAERVPDNGDEAPELPFCVSPSSWVQIIRALTPRTEDFERTVVDLLTSPYVGYRPAVTQSVVEEVVGRMDNLEDASPELAMEVLADSAKVKEIEAAVEGEDEGSLDEAVRVAYSDKARELQEAVAASEARVAATEAKVAAVAKAQEEAERRAADAEEKRDRERDKALGVERDLDREKSEKTKEIGRLEAEAAQARNERDQALAASTASARKLDDHITDDANRRTRRKRIAGGVALVLLGIAIAVVLPVALVTKKGAVAGAIIGGVAFVLLGTRLIAGRKWGGEVVTWAALLAAIAAPVISVIFGGD